MQWHPLFAYLLKLRIGQHFEVEIEQAVSELPRKADVLVVRRQGMSNPFTGLWGWLRPVNVFEYKGPSDYPEAADIELLMHVGSGLTLKLNEELTQRGEPPLGLQDMGYWYFAPRIGATFIDAVLQRTTVGYKGQGLWAGHAFGHPLRLVSYRDLPIEADSVPLHLLRRTGEAQPPHELRELLVSDPDLLRHYAAWIAALPPHLWEELRHMALEVPADWLNWPEVVRTFNARDIARALPPEIRLEGLPPEQLLARLSPEQRLAGLSTEQRLAGVPPEQRLADLTPDQRAALLRQLQQAENPPAS